MSPEELLTQTPPPVPTPAPPAATTTAVALRKEDLHASVSDPVLDTMNFLNEVTARYPTRSRSRRDARTTGSSTPSRSSPTCAATSTI